MNILIFGQSNSAGAQLPGGARPWPQIVEAALPALLGEPVTVTFRTFYAHGVGPAEYAAREMAKHSPDIVILTMAPFAFLAPVVGPGVRKRYGERAGRLYQRLEARFDAGTRNRGGGGAHVNSLARRLMRAILGAAPVASYETVLEGNTAALRQITRSEDARVLVFQGFLQLPGGSPRQQRKPAALVERFYRDMRAVAAEMRCDYINMGEVEPGDVDRWYYPDRVHITAAAHERVARTMMAWITGGERADGEGGGHGTRTN